MKILQENELIEIKEYLDKDNIIALPTDTVYGLAVKLSSNIATKKLQDLKERENKPFVLMVSNNDDIKNYCEVSNYTQNIIDKFLPGELTLVLPKNKTFNNEYFDKLQTIGIRIPNNKFMLELLNVSGPLLVTSANLKGKEPCLNINDVINKLKEVDIIVKGEVSSEIPSTVISTINNEIKILREGKITLKELEK